MKYVFGVDVSKHNLDFCLLNGFEKIADKVVKNNPAAIKLWILAT